MRHRNHRKHRYALAGLSLLAALFAIAAGLVLLPSRADTPTATSQVEAARLDGNASRCLDNTASNGQSSRFGGTACPLYPVPAGQAFGWGLVMHGPGGAWHRMAKLPDGSWLRVLTAFPAAGRAELHIYRSLDNARSWKLLSTVGDGQRLIDNGHLYIAPDGSLLLSGRNLVEGSNYRISQWRSQDAGQTWRRENDLKNAARGAWEPFYYTAGNNRTVAMWSDENRGPNQVIVQRVSADSGRTWGNEQEVVYDGQNARPGMSVVTRMANGQYILVFEVCVTRNCNVYAKTSADGVNWPSGVGSAVPGAQCGPFVTSLTDGRIVVTACRTADNNHATPVVYSNDYGRTWQRNDPAFTDAGVYGHWPAIYQTGQGEITAVSGSRLRFGGIAPR